MKKKNILVMGLSMALVAVISVGGTLAFLTAQTGPVTNTFVASDGITMTLDEAPVDPATGKEIAGNRRANNSYTNIVPNQPLDKDPTVHLTKVPTGGVYLYVKVAGLNPDASKNYTVSTNMDEMADKWIPVDGYTDLYTYAEGGVQAVIEDTDKDDYTVFTEVTFDYEQTIDPETKEVVVPDLDNVVVTAYAVQATNLDADTNTDEMAATALVATEAPVTEE